MIILTLTLIVLYHFFYTECAASFAVLFLRFKKRMKYLENCAASTSKFLFTQVKALVGFTAGYEENDISFPSQFIVVSNHQSLLDVYMILQSCPRIRFIAKKELARKIPGVSAILRYARHCLIDRHKNYRETHRHMLSFADLCAREGLNIHIFPEGTRSKDGKLGEFNSGAYRIIQARLMLPTVVVAFDGGWTYSHIKNLFKKSDYFSYKMKVLSVLPPPENKQEILTQLDDAQQLIEKQLLSWRA